MSQDLIPQSSAVSRRLQAAAPPLLVIGLAGVVVLAFFHLMLLAGVFFAAIAVFGSLRLKAKLALVEGQTLNASAESPEKLLKRRLLRLQIQDGCEEMAQQASEHFDQVRERMNSFDRVLRMKLEPSELTFNRYRSAAEQVYLSVIDRLSEVAELLTSIDASHVSEAKEKLRLAADSPEAPALRERVAVGEGQLAKAKALLQSNEQAFTQMDRASAALTEMKTQTGLATVEFDEALKQLEELARRAKRYSI